MNDFIIALDKAVGIETGKVDMIYANPRVISTDEISVTVAFPYLTYRTALMEAVRKREPIDKVTIPTRVVVSVSVWRLGAPDIIKVIVERDGKEVRPISGALTPTKQRTALGATTYANEGQLFFPCSAFAPGATVTVTAIPSAGRNYVKRFDSTAPENLK